MFKKLGILRCFIASTLDALFSGTRYGLRTHGSRQKKGKRNQTVVCKNAPTVQLTIPSARSGSRKRFQTDRVTHNNANVEQDYSKKTQNL